MANASTTTRTLPPEVLRDFELAAEFQRSLDRPENVIGFYDWLIDHPESRPAIRGRAVEHLWNAAARRQKGAA